MSIAKRISVEVPVKITLFGEHAVVYGKPAIAATIPRFIKIQGSLYSEPIVKLHSRGLYIPMTYAEFHRVKGYVKSYGDEEFSRRVFSYVVEALRLCEEFLGVKRSYGYDITIESSLPVGVGLGTSAAIAVGTISLCIALHQGIEDVGGLKRYIAELGWKTELNVQGAASPMDTFTVTYGGLRYIKPWIPEAEALEFSSIPIVVGFTPKRATTAELVAYVKKLKAILPEVVDEIMNSIGTIVEKARKAIVENDLETLGMLMYVNHGLLSALGVVSPDTDTIIHGLKRAGALGAKMSGAGGGGAFIALAKDERHAEILKNVIASLGGTVVASSIHRFGVRVKSLGS